MRGWQKRHLAVASDMLTANPDIKVIYSANEGGTIGAVQAVKKAGLEGKVFVFGTDGSEQLANMLLDKDNVLQATTAQQPLEVGKQVIEVAQNLLAGKTVRDKDQCSGAASTRANTEGVAALQGRPEGSEVRLVGRAIGPAHTFAAANRDIRMIPTERPEPTPPTGASRSNPSRKVYGPTVALSEFTHVLRASAAFMP